MASEESNAALREALLAYINSIEVRMRLYARYTHALEEILANKGLLTEAEIEAARHEFAAATTAEEDPRFIQLEQLLRAIDKMA
jgi:hypothetical protein